MEKEQWEAGRLIQQARETRGITKRDAARLAGISESWWRKLEYGTETHDSTEIVRPKAETMAKAAQTVGLSPERILAVGGYRDGLSAEIQELHNAIDELDAHQIVSLRAFLRALKPDA